MSRELTPVEMDKLTERIIGCAYTVSNELGAGFVEKVYENALAHELRKAGLRVEQQLPLRVMYDGVVVGGLCRRPARRGLHPDRTEGCQGIRRHSSGAVPQLSQGNGPDTVPAD